jgi:putative membrane protein
MHSAKGFCMGSADIIPGVSGGTMALILGIYERLLAAIRSFNAQWLRCLLSLRVGDALRQNDLPFLVPLGLGIVAAILFFTRVVPLPSLIVTHPELVYGFFFGLIAASVVVLMREVERFGARQLLIAAAGVAFGFAVVNLVPVSTPSAPWFIFLCGFIAISAMLLPGISGSFILLVLGQYAFIINALGSFDWVTIGAFCGGALAGLVVFSRAIGWLLARYHEATLLLIKGILVGSLWVIWPFQERSYAAIRGEDKLIGVSPVLPESLDGTALGSLALMLGGFFLVLMISRLAGNRQ